MLKDRKLYQKDQGISSLTMNALVFVFSAFFTFFTHQIFDQNFANAAQSGLQGKPNENLTFALFSDNLFHFLDVPKIAETYVQTTKQCLLQCIKNHLCLSTNVAAVPQPNGHVSCELLSIDHDKIHFRGSRCPLMRACVFKKITCMCRNFS